MDYKETATSILKDSIKSVVFIDENAHSFGSELSDRSEAQLSLDLYNNFKLSKVSLESIKYKNGDEKDEDWLEYCINNRDLILLDWQLNGDTGEIQSLKILNKIINSTNIHFCVIYTNTKNLNEVLGRIISNYSNIIDKSTYTGYKEYSESFFGEGFDYSEFHRFNLERHNPKIKNEIGKFIKKHRDSLNEFKKLAELPDYLSAICKISIANLSSFDEELNHPLPCPTFINAEKYILEINNTIITILNKSENRPEKLLGNFIDHIINDIDSYNRLLTIDFFNRISEIGIVNNNNKINFAKEALFEHRKRLKDEKLDNFYEEFIKELLLEKLSLSLRDKRSNLLSDKVFEELYDPENKPKIKDSHKMNVFYNSYVLDKKDSYINFGDVFEFLDEDKKGVYLICLTPLCDCLRPQEKTKRNYFFAEGGHINLKDALELGDTAFISFLPNDKVVTWSDVPKKANKYTPIYIKPLQYKVLENEDLIDDKNEINLYYLNKEGERKCRNVRYITTIRENYAQRIANHAFAYPVRVGVDFVKNI